ncbi:hypothetical protein A8B78_20940 [Jannaschia sp. EhC01]|nr:hypothetical protein A8B78_20940 [Jannaschia sp. EhC01]
MGQVSRIMGLVVGLAVWLPLAANAQQIGQLEYMDSCAQCHGASGTGDGPLAGYLNVSLPDLTALQSQNGGVFPVTSVYQIIEGPVSSGAHGTSDMPAWGNRFQARGRLVANPDFSTTEAEIYARFRILALIEYLAGIQQD